MRDEYNHVTEARRPDLLVREKEKNAMNLLDVSAPGDSKKGKKEQENLQNAKKRNGILHNLVIKKAETIIVEVDVFQRNK